MCGVSRGQNTAERSCFIKTKDRIGFFSPSLRRTGKQRRNLRFVVTFHPLIILAPCAKQPLPALKWCYLSWQELMEWPYSLSTGRKLLHGFTVKHLEMWKQPCCIFITNITSVKQQWTVAQHMRGGESFTLQKKKLPIYKVKHLDWIFDKKQL